MKHIVYADLPKSGLGNLLLIWAKAKVFSQINGLPLITSSWSGVRPGAWLRNEKRKRLYWGYFYESPLLQRILIRFRKEYWKIENEPNITKNLFRENKVIFRFYSPVTQSELFGAIKPYRDFIKSEILNLLKPKLRNQFNTLRAPEIAIHIRRGDFKYGCTITPAEFFIGCIQFIRETTGKNLRVTVFTDAEENELTDIFQLENVEMAEEKPDILDILQMSQSRILIISQTSTFSYWAAFLSEAIVVKPFGDWYGQIRPAAINEKHFEGEVGMKIPETLLNLGQALLNEVF